MNRNLNDLHPRARGSNEHFRLNLVSARLQVQRLQLLGSKAFQRCLGVGDPGAKKEIKQTREPLVAEFVERTHRVRGIPELQVAVMAVRTWLANESRPDGEISSSLDSL